MVASEDEELDLSKVPVEDLRGSQVEYSTCTEGTREGGSSKQPFFNGPLLNGPEVWRILEITKVGRRLQQLAAYAPT